MNSANTVTDQNISETSIGGGIYVTLDGLVKYCITAPLLELPVDFNEWYKPTRGNPAPLYRLQASSH